jgi:hypothetical protein
VRRAAALLLAAALLASGPAIAGGGHGGGHGGGGHGHGGHHGWGGGWHHGFNSGFGATFVYGPWFWDPYFFPYAPAYYYPTYVPPPDDVDVPDAAPTGWSTEGDAENPLDASYGLIQLQGVPDGASVELDGRYWMGAARLGERWLALPRGRHTLTVRGTDGATQERLLDVAPGTTVVVQF